MTSTIQSMDESHSSDERGPERTIAELEAEVARLREYISNLGIIPSQQRITVLEKARLVLQSAWEDADVHPRCGAGDCSRCDEVWERGVTAALAPQEKPTGGLLCQRCDAIQRTGEDLPAECPDCPRSEPTGEPR